MSKETDLAEVLHKVFGLAKNTINDQTSPSNVPTWDSMNAMILVSELERTFKVKFTTQDVHQTHNVGDIKKALARHGVKI